MSTSTRTNSKNDGDFRPFSNSLSLDDYYIEDYFTQSDRIRERTCTVSFGRSNRYGTINGDLHDRRIVTFARSLPTIFRYNQDTIEEKTSTSMDDIPEIKENECVWVDIIGVHDKTLLSNISRRFQIHSLVILDISTHEQRTKLDIFEDALFAIMKLIYPDRSTQKTCFEQISFYMKKNLLITFQEGPKDAFDQIKNRIRTNKGRIRRSKIDYLFYVLIDSIVDRYIDVLDIMNTRLETIEKQLLKNISRDVLQTIYDIKRDMLSYRCVISPLKEIIIKLQKEDETQIIQESTIIYFKDLFDHVVQVIDTMDTHREMVKSLIDFYMMLNTDAMNKVIQTLTIISTIFIPLTFIAGVYGMNFENMPELKWGFGYYATLILMLFITILMIFWFKKKRWL